MELPLALCAAQIIPCWGCIFHPRSPNAIRRKCHVLFVQSTKVIKWHVPFRAFWKRDHQKLNKILFKATGKASGRFSDSQFKFGVANGDAIENDPFNQTTEDWVLAVQSSSITSDTILRFLYCSQHTTGQILWWHFTRTSFDGSKTTRHTSMRTGKERGKDRACAV